MNRRLQRALLQTLYAGGLAIIVITVVVTAANNLEKQGITTGFTFLWRSVGWDIGFAFIPTTVSDPYWWILLMGLMNTVVVGVAAMVLATAIGLVLAGMRLSGNFVLNALATTHIIAARNIPPVVQILIWYALINSLPAPRNAIQLTGGVIITGRGFYFPAANVSNWATWLAVFIIISMLTGFVLLAFGSRNWFTPTRRKLARALSFLVFSIASISVIFALTRIPNTELVSYPELKGFNIRGGMSLSTELLAVLCNMVFFGSAFMAEVLRGGFLSIDKGQIEASKALGMSPWMAFSRVQVPIIVKNTLPMMTNLFVWLIKATAMGIVVGFSDLFTLVINSINQSGQTLELIFIVAFAFWALNTGTIALLTRADRRMQAVGIRNPRRNVP